VKSSNADAGDQFGWSVALSDDGNLMVVGAPTEQSNARGVNGNQADNSSANAGAGYVFTRSGADVDAADLLERCADRSREISSASPSICRATAHARHQRLRRRRRHRRDQRHEADNTRGGSGCVLHLRARRRELEADDVPQGVEPRSSAGRVRLGARDQRRWTDARDRRAG
jgi:hypothetical protein